MPDVEGILNGINALLQSIFGKNHVPGWILPVVAVAVLFFCLFRSLHSLLVLLSKIKDVWIKEFLPLFYNKESKQRRYRRRRFAENIAHELRILNTREDWQDYRFAELEAEVEAEGDRKHSLFLPFGRQQNELRRERSLSDALASSRERCILLEGDPGSGKSVALRYVAMHVVSKALRAHHNGSIIPIYVNLKGLERQGGETIDRNLIERFILQSLRRSNDSDVELFLSEEFRRGCQEGTWLFLFDSFDELPEVLSSTETDNVIMQYGNAIADFLEAGMNQCRGVIASRRFRGPKYSGWPRFRILELSEQRRHELIHKVGLSSQVERELFGHLGATSDEIRIWASNPLFLALLCKHMYNKKPFPKNVHVVFQEYIDDRLERDRERVQKHFGLDPEELGLTAKRVAFCMTIDQGLGLCPTRAKLRAAMKEKKIFVSPQFDMQLDALEYVKLARSDTGTAVADERIFTFAHRRFQEYFATLVVLDRPELVPTRQLLTDGRWRESAVVMCQIQPLEKLQSLLVCAEELLYEYRSAIPELITDPEDQLRQTQQKQEIKRFSWPTNALALLDLLQNGLASRLHESGVSPNLRLLAGQIGLTATQTGTLGDRKWALEVAGIAPEKVFHYMLQCAFTGRSQWLKDVAYRQVARSQIIKPTVEGGIRLAIVDMYMAGRLKREHYATQTHLARLPQPVDRNLLSIINLLLALPWIKAAWYAFFFLLFAIYLLPYDHFVERCAIVAGMTLLTYTMPQGRFLYLSFLMTGLLFIPDAGYRTIFQAITTTVPDILAHWQHYYDQIAAGQPIQGNPSLGNVLQNVFVNAGEQIFILLLLMCQCDSVVAASITSAKMMRRTNWLFYLFIPFYPSLISLALLIVKAFGSLNLLIVNAFGSWKKRVLSIPIVSIFGVLKENVTKVEPWKVRYDRFVTGFSILLVFVLLLLLMLLLIAIVEFLYVIFKALVTFFAPIGGILLLIGMIILFVVVGLLFLGILYGIYRYFIYLRAKKFTFHKLCRMLVKGWWMSLAMLVRGWRAGLQMLGKQWQEVRKELQTLRLRNEWEQRWRRQPVEYQDFFLLIKAYRNNMLQLLEIIQYTRRYQHLIPSREAEEELKELAFQIEKDHLQATDFFQTALLDELYRLIEDVAIPS